MTAVAVTGTVTIGERQWAVEVASTPAKLTTGLGGLDSIPADTGMLFDLGYNRTVQVTTEPMLFNIDIIFIGESLQVEDVALDIPPGHLITQEMPVRCFLEVNSGEAQGVEIGSHVNLTLDYDTSDDTSIIGEVTDITEFMSFVVTAVIVGLFTGGMIKAFTRAALGKAKRKEKPPLRLEYPEFEYLSSTGNYAEGT